MKTEKQDALELVFKNGTYWCSEDGKVFSLVNDGPFAGKIHEKSSRITRSGYPLITLSVANKRYDYLVHQVIWFYFNGRYAPHLQINHINGVKTDNKLKNLEVVTSSENHKHAHRLGLETQVGEHNAASKLTNARVKVIRSAFTQMRLTNKEIAEIFGVSRSLVTQVKQRKIWGHV